MITARMRLGVAVMAVVAAVGAAPPVGAQTSDAAQTETQLRDEIRRRQLVENDASIPADEKTMNRQILVERSARLKLVLQQKLDALRRYKTTLGDKITEGELAEVNGSIDDVSRELEPMETSSAAPAAVISDTPRAAPAAGRATGGVITLRPFSAIAPSAASAPAAQPTQGGGAPSGGMVVRPDTSLASSTPAPGTTAQPAPQGAATADGTDPIPPGCEDFAKNPKTFSVVDRYRCALGARVAERKKKGGPLIDLQADSFELLALLVARTKDGAYLTEAEEARTDKQQGAGPSSSGSTSLVVKGGAPAILGLAVENGALTQTMTGSTITFRGNPVGIVEALANKGYLEGYRLDDPTTRLLRKTSFSFSFDTERGDMPGTLTASRQQLSQFSFRYEFVNHRDPRRGEFRKDWDSFVAGDGQLMAKLVDVAQEVVFARDPKDNPIGFVDPKLDAWYSDTLKALTAASSDEVQRVLLERYYALPTEDLTGDTGVFISEFDEQFDRFLAARQSVLDKVAKGSIFTFEYTGTREVNTPDLSNFRFIGETSFGKNIDFTSNASFTIFNKRPEGTGAGRVRDFQFAAQMDVPLGDVVKGYGPFVLSLAGRYERLREGAPMDPAMMTADMTGDMMSGMRRRQDGAGMEMMMMPMLPPGDLGIGQIKLTIPIKGTGVKIPLSITFANRTEAIMEREVRGNFGITFDLDTLFTKFKP